MLRDITLPFWPTAYSSFKWSADGQLCIPVDNRIYILAPACFNPLQTPKPPGRLNNEKAEGLDEDDEQGNSKRPTGSTKTAKGKAATAAATAAAGTQPKKGKGNGKGKANEGADNETKGDATVDDNAGPSGANDGEDTHAGIDQDHEEFDAEGCDYEKFFHPAERAFTPPRQQFHYSQIRIEFEKEFEGYYVDEWSNSETENSNQVFKLEWSPLGVTKNKRCVLAVLTTGHKVLLYTPKSVLGGEWELAHDITKTFRGPMVSNGEDGEKHDVWAERWIKGRTRDLSWSSACRFPGNGVLFSLLAMSNDDNEIRLVSVTNTNIKLHLLKRVSESKGAYIKNMCWSSWTLLSDSLAAAWLAFSLGSEQYALRVNLSIAGGSSIAVTAGALHRIPTARLSPSHQPSMSCWFYRPIRQPINSAKNDTVYLFAVVLQTSVQIFTLDVMAEKFSSSKLLQKIEVELVDQVVGANFVYGKQPGTIDLNIVTVAGNFVQIACISDEEVITPVIYRSCDVQVDHVALKRTDFMRALHRKRVNFVKRKKITNAYFRNFGLAVSPYAGYVAILSRLKPDGYIEFTMKSDEDCMIIFSQSRNVDSILEFEDDGTMIPVASTTYDLSTEAFLADISHATRYLRSSKSFYNDLESRLMAKQAHRLQYASKLLRRNQISVRSKLTLVPTREVMLRLLRSVLSVPMEAIHAMVASSNLSQMIIYFYGCVVAIGFYKDPQLFTEATLKLRALRDSFGYDIEEVMSLIIQRIAAINGQRPMDAVPDAIHESAIERCSWCNADMPFEDLATAYCENNHQFRRCALTFVALQQGTSRRCTICAKEFFAENMLLDDEQSNNSDNNSTERRYKSFARLCYETVDLCPYCGGCLVEQTSDLT